MRSDLQRRLARIEQATRPTGPDPADVADLARYEASLGPDFLPWAEAEAETGPLPSPTDPRARISALREALIFYLTGCHPPTGPDPMPNAGDGDGDKEASAHERAEN